MKEHLKVYFGGIDLDLKDLLVYLHFIKCYPTIDQLQQYHKISSKTILKRINNFKKNLIILNELNPLNSNDRFNQRPLIIDGIIIYSIVETTFFNIQKPTVFSDIF
ncbi:hypothetical protein ACTFIU_007677 [Dictyostelium citrinum]